jgi:hypothetical protein
VLKEKVGEVWNSGVPILYLQYSIAYKSEYRRHVGTIKLRGLSLVNSGLSLVKGGLSLTTPLFKHPQY